MKMVSAESDSIMRRVVSALLMAITLAACSQPTDSELSQASAKPPATTIATMSTEGPAVDKNTLIEILQMSNTLARVESVAATLGATASNRLDGVLAAFETAALDQGDVEYVLLIEWWARFDPAEAYLYTQRELRTEYPRTVLAAARAWARVDPVGALDSGYFLEKHSDSSLYRIEMLDSFVVGWFESGNPGLEEFLTNLEGNADIVRGMRTYARMRVLRDGARETLEWTQQQSGFPEAHHRLLIAGALTLIAHQNPRLATEWLPIAEAGGVDIRSFLPRIASAWAHHDPKSALDWLTTFPDTAERVRAIRRVGTRWNKSDPDGMEAWLGGRPHEQWPDSLRLQLVRGVAIRDNYRTDWHVAMQRTQKIVNSRLREQQRIWNLQRWLLAEPDAAETWIDSHKDELTDSVIQQARSMSMGERTRVEKALGLSTVKDS